MKLAKETLTGDAKQEAVKAAEAEKDAALYRTHFAFPADLSLYLDAKQIDAVKDGMTYGVVMVTYKATVDMIPTLKEEEKRRLWHGLLKPVNLPWMLKIQIRNMLLSANTKAGLIITSLSGDMI